VGHQFERVRDPELDPDPHSSNSKRLDPDPHIPVGNEGGSETLVIKQKKSIQWPTYSTSILKLQVPVLLC
jgi:hypothetical protein